MGNQTKKPHKKPRINEYELICIIRKASDFLSANDSLKLLCLNRYFNQQLPNYEYYFYLSKYIPSTIAWIANLDQNDPELLDHFARFLERKPFTSNDDWIRCIKSAQNLIKNPCGEMQYEFWDKRDGGGGWNIEDWPGYKHKKTVFVSSYEWCDLTQVINIPLSTKMRFIIIGAYVSRRDDCGALAKLKAEVYTENHEKTDTYEIDEVSIPEPGPVFYMLKTKFEIQSYHRTIKITYSGKDTRLWAGNYGARFSYCFARIFNRT